MRKLGSTLAAAAVLTGARGRCRAGGAGVAPAAPASFVLVIEKSVSAGGRTMTVRLWLNGANGRLHGEVVEPGWFDGMHVVVVQGNNPPRAVIQGDGFGPGPISTGEVAQAAHDKECGWDEPGLATTTSAPA